MLSDRLGALRERNFRLLFTGQAVSMLGDGMVAVAMAFAVLDLTGSATDLGLVLAAPRLPMVLFMLVGGVFADRFPRRAVMLGSDLVRMVTYGGIAALLLAGHAQLWQLVVLQLVTGTASAFFFPATLGLVPMTVTAERLQQANGLWSMAQAGGGILGPALAGALVVAVGPGWALGANAITFGVSALSLAFLHVPPHVKLEPKSFLRDLGDGWREIRARTWLWSTIAVSTLSNVVAPALPVVGAALAKAQLGGASVWGAIIASIGVGALLGGLVVLRIRPRRPLVAVALGDAAFSIPYFALALVLPVPVVVVAALLGGIGQIVGNTYFTTTVQRQVPPATLSRVMSFTFVGAAGLSPIGLALVGAVAAAIGDAATLAIAGAYLAVSGLLLVAIPSVRAIRDEPVA